MSRQEDDSTNEWSQGRRANLQSTISKARQEGQGSPKILLVLQAKPANCGQSRNLGHLTAHAEPSWVPFSVTGHAQGLEFMLHLSESTVRQRHDPANF